jgi:bifunctional oligoribonuclease and PAP phosphatase NrnA
LIKKIANFIRNNDDFLIAGHISADGDAISASLAISVLLDSLGKKYRLLFDDVKVDPRFEYLKNYNLIKCARNEKISKMKAAIICDTPTTERMGAAVNFLPEYSQTVKIDHHPDEEDFALYNLVDLDSSSTTCLVYKIMEEFDIKYDQDLAQIVLSGLMYDTGRFSYRNTKAIDFEIAAKMLTSGANPELSYKKIFAESSLKALNTIGFGLSNMETFYNNQVGIIYLDNNETKKNRSDEIEELASYSTSVKGCHVGYFIREAEPGLFKISLRSKGDVNVNEVAAKFGGGGHQKASGCRMEGSIGDIKKTILAETEKHLKKHNYL